MPTKQNPGAFDCYKAALPDEPIFVILGRDPAGPATLDFWAAQRIKRGKTVGDDDKSRIGAAIDEAKKMQDWRSRMLEASVDGVPPWRLPVHFIGEAEMEHPELAEGLSRTRISELLDYATVYGAVDENSPNGPIDDPLAGEYMTDVRRGAIWAYKRVLGLLENHSLAPEPQGSSREQYVPVEEAAYDAAKRDERTIRLLATMRAALEKVEKAHKSTLDPWIALSEIEHILTTGINAVPTVAEEPPVAESIPAKPPVIDSAPEDLAHAPEVPHHRFSAFHKAGEYAYARGLEINPMHLPVALDAMAQSGWHLLAIFGATDSQHIGFIFRREPPTVAVWSGWEARNSTERAESPAFQMYMDGRPLDEIKAAISKDTPVERAVIEYAERMANGECRITRVPFDDLPEWTHPCYGRGRGQQP